MSYSYELTLFEQCYADARHSYKMCAYKEAHGQITAAVANYMIGFAEMQEHWTSAYVPLDDFLSFVRARCQDLWAMDNELSFPDSRLLSGIISCFAHVCDILEHHVEALFLYDVRRMLEHVSTRRAALHLPHQRCRQCTESLA